MKNFYYIIDIRENDKCCCHMAKIPEHTNIKNHSILNQENIVSITPCDTLKNAREIVEAQNLMYKSAGIYLFDDEPQF